MHEHPSVPHPRPSHRWSDWLGLNASTAALLATILFVTAATELWSPIVSQYLKALRLREGAGAWEIIVIVGVYGFYRDGLEALNYLIGGALAGRFNTRRTLLAFNMLPLIGLGILALWDSTLAVFAAIPFVFAWDSIAGPAVITVVGEALPSDRRTMAFSLQSIFRRVSRILAYAISAPLIWYFGEIGGVRADAVIALLLVIAALAIQLRFLRTSTRDTVSSMHRPRHLFRKFPADLKRLLAADVFARWAEGLAGPFIILYCVPILSPESDKGTALYQSVLLTIMAATNIVLYVVVGPLASREGLAKKPYIGLTFLFFALFPVSLIVLGKSMGSLGLGLAFVIGGFREIGEPARKAMIADLVPADVRTQAVGLYWGVRSLSVMCAAPVGAFLWILGERAGKGLGFTVSFLTAGFLGVVGVAAFFLRFGRSTEVR